MRKDSASFSIGMFDSGVGGLTVMQQMVKTLPNEPIVYFGDTARLPYGEKSRETIIRYTIESSIFLMQQNIKALVIACNTATTYALEKLQQIFNIPVIGVIAPGAERAVQVTRNRQIAVLGTRGTVRSGIYQREIQRHLPDAKVTSIACPLFVPLVEEHLVTHPATRLIVKEYLAPLHDTEIDTILLGCTHYPLLRHLIEEEFGPNISIVDSAATCAAKVSEILTSLMLHNQSANSSPYRYYVSDDPQKFQILGKNFLGMPLDHVEAVSLFANL